MTACSKQSPPAVKAGVYTRISSDPSGQRAGVDRQQADCEVHCLARGWEVIEVFCDNDTSAYGRKPRRAYERMLAAVENLELAEQGRPAGQLGWAVRSEDERELVREAARRVLEGDGLMTIARDWNTRSVPGASGGPWTAPTLRRVLLSSRIAGLREHGVDPSGKTLGDLSPAVWAAALDRQTWDQVRAVLLNLERNTNVRKATRYLLTELIHCGDCGAALFSRRATTSGATSALDVDPAISWGSLPIPSTNSSRSSYSGCSRRRRYERRCSPRPAQAMRGRWVAHSPTSAWRSAGCRLSMTTSPCVACWPRGGTGRSGSSWSGRSTASTPWSTPGPSSASSCTPIPVRSGRRPTSISDGTWSG